MKKEKVYWKYKKLELKYDNKKLSYLIVIIIFFVIKRGRHKAHLSTAKTKSGLTWHTPNGNWAKE